MQDPKKALDLLNSSNELYFLIISILVAYFLGSVPIADRISRRRGIDIFSKGTGLAGATNVRKEVGFKSSIIVVAGDTLKGILAILVAQKFGVSGYWIFLPAFAAIAGHWRSVFTNFRGGDGLIVLGGIIVALFDVFGVISITLAMLIGLGGQKLFYSSLMSIVAGNVSLIVLSATFEGPQIFKLAVGTGILSTLVLIHALKGHSKRNKEKVLDQQFQSEAHTLKN